MKRFLIAGSMIAVLLQSVPSIAAANTSKIFTDVKSTHWAATTIHELVGKGYMKGYSDGSFKPNQATTRGEAAAIIARTMGIEITTNYQPKFQDVTVKHPYYQAISKLVEMGVLADGNYFYPNAPLKRSEISKIIARAYGVEVDHKNKTSFKDLKSNFWAKDYIESLADANLIKGVTATTFAPNENVTRAQIALLTKRGMAFKGQVANLEVAYDFLQKDYISTVNSYKSWENKIASLVNEIRGKNSLKPVEIDPYLTQIAIIKAKDMVKRNYFEHYSPFYGNPWDLATLFDYEYSSFGENIARNYSTPEAAVNAWMNSPKHRANILKENYSFMGIGIEKTISGKYYIVQHFSDK